MSNDDVPVGSYVGDNTARVVREWEVRSYLGQILTIVDSLGLPEKQEKAIKDLVKRTTWGDLWNGGSIVIYTKEAQELLAKAIEAEHAAQANDAPQTNRIVS